MLIKEKFIEILYIILGWLFGLLSPTVINYVKKHYDNKKFLIATNIELSELQFRLCLTGLILGQRYGSIDKEYLLEVKSILNKYDGEDTPETIITLIDLMLEANDEYFNSLIISMRSINVNFSLMRHSTILIDTNAMQISAFPTELQSKIYEFRNALNIYNQKVLLAQEKLNITYDSSLSEINREIINDNILELYADLQQVSLRVCRKIQIIMDTKL